jgi:hypothetical protein
MKKLFALLLILISLPALACGTSTASQTLAPIPSLASDPFQKQQTNYGFFPSPSEATIQGVFDNYKAMGQHADVSLLQKEIPWQDFEKSADGHSQTIDDIHNQYVLAHQNGLEIIFVVDALNGLNRSQFYHLPFGWQASFGNAKVRAAFTNYTLRVLREFHPRYLGLGSEVNTYMDVHPEDKQNYLSLYREVYDLIKAESPETQVFATFQWEDLKNLAPFPNENRASGQINWDEIEAFEPRLDLWVISSYPFVVFKSGDQIPADYYTPLLARTSKPIAVAEGGYTSQAVGNFEGTPQDQVAYLTAIHSQLGSRLSFWIYLLLRDFNLDSYASMLRQQGASGDVSTLGWFASVGLSQRDGTAKPGLELWDSYRAKRKP